MEMKLRKLQEFSKGAKMTFFGNSWTFIYLFIYLFRWRASYNNNRDLNNRKTLKQQDLEGRERLY